MANDISDGDDLSSSEFSSLDEFDLTVDDSTENADSTRPQQWRSQDIAFAKAQRGHTNTFVRTSAQAYRGSVGILPRKFRNFTASQVGSEAIYRSEVHVTHFEGEYCL